MHLRRELEGRRAEERTRDRRCGAAAGSAPLAPLLLLRRAVGNRALSQLLARNGGSSGYPFGGPLVPSWGQKRTLTFPARRDEEDTDEESERDDLEDLEDELDLEDEAEIDRIRELEDFATEQYFERQRRTDVAATWRADRAELTEELAKLNAVGAGKLDIFSIVSDPVAKAGQYKTQLGGEDEYEKLKQERDRIIAYAENWDTRTKLIREHALTVIGEVDPDKALWGREPSSSAFTATVETVGRLRHHIRRGLRIVRLAEEFRAALRQQLSGIKGSGVSAPPPDPVFTEKTPGATVVKSLPVSFGNELRAANDMMNNPTTGHTGFTVRGKPVYHSSAGSSSTADPGTLFWILGNNDSRVLVATGFHSGGQTDTYRITWRATGVTGYFVELGSTASSSQLRG